MCALALLLALCQHATLRIVLRQGGSRVDGLRVAFYARRKTMRERDRGRGHGTWQPRRGGPRSRRDRERTAARRRRRRIQGPAAHPRAGAAWSAPSRHRPPSRSRARRAPLEGPRAGRRRAPQRRGRPRRWGRALVGGRTRRGCVGDPAGRVAHRPRPPSPAPRQSLTGKTAAGVARPRRRCRRQRCS